MEHLLALSLALAAGPYFHVRVPLGFVEEGEGVACVRLVSTPGLAEARLEVVRPRGRGEVIADLAPLPEGVTPADLADPRRLLRSLGGIVFREGLRPEPLPETFWTAGAPVSAAVVIAGEGHHLHVRDVDGARPSIALSADGQPARSVEVAAMPPRIERIGRPALSPDGDLALFVVWFKPGSLDGRPFHAQDIQVVDLRRGAAMLLDIEALGFLKGGDLEEARRLLERAVRVDHAYFNALYNLACVASLSGEAGEALDWLGRAAEADPAEFRRLVYSDGDLDPLRGLAPFDAFLPSRLPP